MEIIIKHVKLMNVIKSYEQDKLLYITLMCLMFEV